VSDPFFTIAVPTKNRPERVRDAVRSVLDQTFGDVEVIVCDNSDEHAPAARFDDPRVRHVRTDGTLSMPDNWDRAIADARGEYVGILTDRSVFRRDALETVRREIEATGAPLVNWFSDLYGRGPEGNEYRRRECTFKRYRHSGEEVLDFFVHGDPKYAPKAVPRLMTGVCHRPVLEAIRSSAVGRVCPPVAPDFTSGFLMLAHAGFALTIDEALYVSVGKGNGAAFRRGDPLADRFRADLGMDWADFVDRMPSDACFAHALMLNDLMRVRDALPEGFGGIEVDRRQYYAGCLADYFKSAREGTHRSEDLASLLAALEREPADVRQWVRRTPVYAAATRRPGGVKERVQATMDKLAPPPLPAFDTVFDALAWDEANPREPAGASFLELRGYGLDEAGQFRRPRYRRLGRALGNVAQRVR
jgi:glycosyltransferase involved in cell wall biosynthesis